MTLIVQILLTIFIALILIFLFIISPLIYFTDWDIWILIADIFLIIDILIALTLIFNLIWRWF